MVLEKEIELNTNRKKNLAGQQPMEHLSFYTYGEPNLSVLRNVKHPNDVVSTIRELCQGYRNYRGMDKLPLSGYFYNLLMAVRQLDLSPTEARRWYMAIAFTTILPSHSRDIPMYEAFRDATPSEPISTYSRGRPTALGFTYSDMIE